MGAVIGFCAVFFNQCVIMPKLERARRRKVYRCGVSHVNRLPLMGRGRLRIKMLAWEENMGKKALWSSSPSNLQSHQCIPLAKPTGSQRAEDKVLERIEVKLLGHSKASKRGRMDLEGQTKTSQHSVLP